MIEIRNLSAAYDGEAVLRGIDIEIPTGTTAAVIGPSGCGKSTLLGIIAGLNTQYSGTVKIDGAAPDPHRQCIGYIPQSYGLLPWLRVRDNIMLGLRIKQGGSAAFPAALADTLGLAPLLSRYPGELSGGQKQRVSLARAFALKADLLLMDEPFSALDAITREEMQDVFIALWQKQRVSTVFVTHYVEEALYMGQKIIVMTNLPSSVYKVIDNPLFGDKDFRDKPDFARLAKMLRQYLRKAGTNADHEA